VAGVLTRSNGDFGDILERSDLVVELMGGIEPALEYVLEAMRAGKHVVTANKQLLSQHGESCTPRRSTPASSFASRPPSPGSSRRSA